MRDGIKRTIENIYKCIRCNTMEIALFMSQVNWPMQKVGPASELALCDSCKRQIEVIKIKENIK